jgi:hypothetical protein
LPETVWICPDGLCMCSGQAVMSIGPFGSRRDCFGEICFIFDFVVQSRAGEMPRGNRENNTSQSCDPQMGPSVSVMSHPTSRPLSGALREGRKLDGRLCMKTILENKSMSIPRVDSDKRSHPFSGIGGISGRGAVDSWAPLTRHLVC